MDTDHEREQACHQYYQPWLTAHGTSQPVNEALEQLASLGPQASDCKSFTARDPILVAIAQNVVLRLNLRRCMISLLDTKHQYVIAEATRSCSNSHKNGKEGDEIWLGNAVLSRPDTISENCLESHCQTQEESGNVYECAGMIINDCRQDERFAGRPYVMQEEGYRVRFYAGVPLISPDGFKIGVLAVSDESTRDGLTAEEIRYMQDMAACAMDHLEWALDRVDRFKGERVARGMATFVDETLQVLEGSPDAAASRLDEIQRVSSSDQSVSSCSVPQLKSTEDDLEAQSTETERQVPREQSDRSERPIDHFPYSNSELQDSQHEDSMEKMFTSAATILQKATLADGCIIFGAAIDMKQNTAEDCQANSSTESPEPPHHDRPCRLLAQSTNGHQRAVQDPLPIDTLQQLSEHYPQGSVFTAMQHEQSRREIDTIFKYFLNAQTIVFLPLIDHSEGKLIAGLFTWSTVTGRMSLQAGLSHLRAFAICMEREIVRINMQRNEAAKTTFIASMSHELRSPLHGILGATEFLMDSARTAYETGLITSVALCGTQLLDTLNHVMDHSKINNIQALRGQDVSIGAINEAVDLSALVEEASEAITIGYTFKTANEFKSNSIASKRPTIHRFDTLTSLNNDQSSRLSPEGVTILLDIRPAQNWMVKTPPGALQRVVMNLLGNALKFTSNGFAALSLRATGQPDAENKLDILIRVVDSGKGISTAFQKDKMFRPFSQEDSFTPGTGLGLSIVRQIVNDLGGSIEVNSRENHGTEIDVKLRLSTVPQDHPQSDDSLRQNSYTMHADLNLVNKMARGKHLVLLDPMDPEQSRSPLEPASRFQQNLRETCEQWFGMKVTRATTMSENDEDIAIYLYGEPPPVEMLAMHKTVHPDQPVPVILACRNDRDAITVIKHHQAFLNEVGQIVEVMQQPCGPRKLAMVLLQCFNRQASHKGTDRAKQENTTSKQESDHGRTADSLSKSVSAAVALPAESPVIDLASPGFRSQNEDVLDLLEPHSSVSVQRQRQINPGKSHALIVDDNKINRQLLMTFFSKGGHSYEEAENGKEAVDKFLATVDGNSLSFDVIMMDISMPVMDGCEATRQIRHQEQTKSLGRTKIIALTGLGSAKAREDAEAAGVDVFMAKPVKFAELKKILKIEKEDQVESKSADDC